MKFMYEGIQFEFRGEYREVRKPDHFLSNTGHILQGYAEPEEIRAIVHPVPVLHQFGGIEFRETGEVRTGNLEKGEIGIFDTGNVVIAAHTIFNNHTVWTILERVRIL